MILVIGNVSDIGDTRRLYNEEGVRRQWGHDVRYAYNIESLRGLRLRNSETLLVYFCTNIFRMSEYRRGIIDYILIIANSSDIQVISTLDMRECVCYSSLENTINTMRADYYTPVSDNELLNDHSMYYGQTETLVSYHTPPASPTVATNVVDAPPVVQRNKLTMISLLEKWNDTRNCL